MTSRLDSRALALFLAVADTLSFRQAAQTLHMTQPPLSRAIRELEERLGLRLFERDTRGVALTEAGQLLLPHARAVARSLHEAQAALARVRERAAPAPLRLGVTSAVELPVLRRLQGRLALKLVSDTSPRLVRQLRAGRLDAAVVALPTETHELDVVELERQPMLVALAASHTLARRRLLRLADLAQEALFWFERARQPAFYDHCQQVFAQHGFAPPRLQEPADHHVLLAEVAAGKGVALLPQSFSGLKRAGVSYRRLAEGQALAVGVGLVTPGDRRPVRDLLLGWLRPAPGPQTKQAEVQADA
ncbi:LysR family transcriptional regulator [Rubrivivax gelatinosus]|uniref:LysR substrate-binding domain-containing protein n=1 Tax=Rubrivivax gelatinosus TaxID=28068 RepID=UPI001903777E|nr:LysR family transcriptional regulator [Rubrivivax gelatinosus]MBK1615823.1 LysR family transcriptional regulator [Rubrivivax gelatinosus]